MGGGEVLQINLLSAKEESAPDLYCEIFLGRHSELKLKKSRELTYQVNLKSQIIPLMLWGLESSCMTN